MNQEIMIVNNFYLRYLQNYMRDQLSHQYLPVDIYMFKVNNRNTRTRCEICSKLTIKTSDEKINADW